jgi:hypothetical protein
MTLTAWYALEPLPLNQVVQFELQCGSTVSRDRLVRYQWTGAEPLLAIPEHREPE